MRRGLPEQVARHLRRDLPLAFLDVGIVFLAYLVPLVLRFDANVPGSYWDAYRSFLPVVAFLHLVCNYLFGLYGQMWRYASIQEARRVVLAGLTAGVFVISAATWLGRNIRLLPLSVMALGAILAFLGFGAIRFQSRLFALRRGSLIKNASRTLIVGAGDAGASLIKELLKNPSLGLEPVAFVDDDPRKVGLTLHGVSVLGPLRAIPTLAERLKVDQVLLAIPSATSKVVRDVASLCEQVDATLRVLPSATETVTGRVTARDIRDLSIEDLLGRQQVSTDLELVDELLRGRTVLVTGAGGSIGSEICRQVKQFSPAVLIMLDHDETHLHDILTEIDDGTCKGVLADVRDRGKVIGVFMSHRPDIVFHAAANKHVPVLEDFPEEALHTNVMGTANVVDAAVATQVERFILISTDKAIKPSSVMGSSKWFAEQIVWSQGLGRRYCAVRFGNVLGSRGSVIPTFFRQIAQGGPVTVTDPEMTRYFMSVQEAVQLVLQAAALSQGGEVFTLDMGEPIKVLELARELIRLSGRVPGRDVEIQFTGVRPGEKLVEDLVDTAELSIPSGHPSITGSRPTVPDRAALRKAIRRLEALSSDGQTDELATMIKLMAGLPLEPIPEEVKL
ncbi:MAG: polysaccharide biosynthesis protein [Actinomycetota bacterium]